MAEAAAVSHTRWPAMYRLRDTFNGYLWASRPKFAGVFQRMDVEQPVQVWGLSSGAYESAEGTSIRMQAGSASSSSTGVGGDGAHFTITAGRGGGSTNYYDPVAGADDWTQSGEGGDMYIRAGDGGGCCWRYTDLTPTLRVELPRLQREVLGIYNDLTKFGSDDKERPKLWAQYARPNIGVGGSGGDVYIMGGDAGVGVLGARGGDVFMVPGARSTLLSGWGDFFGKNRGHICFARGSTDSYNAADSSTWSQTLGRAEGCTMNWVTEIVDYGDLSGVTQDCTPRPNSIYTCSNSTSPGILRLPTAVTIFPEYVDHPSGTFDYACFSFFVKNSGAWVLRVQALDATVTLIPYTPFDLINSEMAEFRVLFRDDVGGQRAYVYEISRATDA